VRSLLLETRRDDSGWQSRPLVRSPLLFRLLSPLTAGLISPRLCGWGGGGDEGVEIIFFILAKQMPVIIRVELNYFEVAIFIPYYVLYLGYIYHTLIDVLLVFSSPMLMY